MTVHNVSDIPKQPDGAYWCVGGMIMGKISSIGPEDTPFVLLSYHNLLADLFPCCLSRKLPSLEEQE